MSAGETPPQKLLVWRDGPTFRREILPRCSDDWHVAQYVPRTTDSTGTLDLLRPWPYPADGTAAVYLRRILEHLTPKEARSVLAEARRILRPGGALRISVPDLESLVRDYLRALELRRAGAAEGAQRLDEARIELIDQMVRVDSGGELLRHLETNAYDVVRLRERWGDALEFLIADSPPRPSPARPRSRFWPLRRKAARHVDAADPRRTREAHLWMYDGISLPALCLECGFVAAAVVVYDESRIRDFAKAAPDTSNRGDYAFEPSLFVECEKPPSETDA